MNRAQRRAAQRNGGQQMEVPPMQEIWPVAMAELGPPTDDGSRTLVVTVPRPFKMMLFALSPENVKDLGNAALAEHVKVASPAEAEAEATASGLLVAGKTD